MNQLNKKRIEKKLSSEISEIVKRQQKKIKRTKADYLERKTKLTSLSSSDQEKREVSKY